MNHTLGLCSVSFRDRSPEDILKEMKKAGLSAIEWGSDVHCPPEKAESIAALTKEHGITCSSYGTYFRLGVTPLSELSAYMEAASILGTNLLRLWCGHQNSEDYGDRERELLWDDCKRAAEEAEKAGMILCLECHKKTFTNRKEAALSLMRAVDSPSFRMYWQPSQHRSFKENLSYAESLAPYTEHLHVFNWREKEKFPLEEAVEEWRRYLGAFDGPHTLLLEFMPDGKLESLTREADALREIVK
ncbi:MAG: sugar phosphate isomerase/epimerase [Clostridia bacterium]|nr:sugar phosphate isomerase/epimerase [Clostridia bacterium]